MIQKRALSKEVKFYAFTYFFPTFDKRLQKLQTNERPFVLKRTSTVVNSKTTTRFSITSNLSTGNEKNV